MNTDEMILWFGVFSAVIIIIAWYFSVFISSETVDFSGLSEDQRGIKSIVSDLCFVDYYDYDYILSAKNYLLTINDTGVCVNQYNYSSCSPLVCQIGNYSFNITKYSGLNFFKDKDNDPPIRINLI